MNEILKKRSSWLAVTIYMVVWLFCVGWFWLGKDGGGWIMAYTILAFMVLMPLTALVSAFLLAWKRPLGGWFWGALILYGTLNFGAIAATFVLSTSLGITRLASPDILIFLLDMIPGAVGLCLGWLFRVRSWKPQAAAIAFYLNYSAQEQVVSYLNEAGTDLITGTSVQSGEKLTIGPWDLKIVEMY